MIGQIVPTDLARRLRESPDEVLLLDVRESSEREFAVILPSLHIPMRELRARASEIPGDREVVVYCHTGVRSEMAAAYLVTHGFSRVSNLVGGIDRWSTDVDRRVPRYFWPDHIGAVLT